MSASSLKFIHLSDIHFHYSTSNSHYDLDRSIRACAIIAANELTPEEAISIVRRARAGTIQTRGQEEFVKLFYNFFIKKRSDAQLLQPHLTGTEMDEA